MALNPYINSFDTQADFEEYLDGSTAKAPNVAYIRATDEMKYTKAVPNPTWIIYGNTTGTEDFYVGSGSPYGTPSASSGIHIHVEGGIFYATAEDVAGTPSYFARYNGFCASDGGKKITKLKRLIYQSPYLSDIYWMFKNCTSLISADLNGFNISTVKDMNSMFSGCSSLTSLDLSSFDTTKVTSIGSMFSGCSSLNKLILGHGFFNSTKLTEYPLNDLSAWTDADSLEALVQAAEVHDGTGKTISLSTQTKNALTQAQKDRITGAGWTIG